MPRQRQDTSRSLRNEVAELRHRIEALEGRRVAPLAPLDSGTAARILGVSKGWTRKLAVLHGFGDKERSRWRMDAAKLELYVKDHRPGRMPAFRRWTA